MKSLSHGAGILFVEMQLNGLLSNHLNTAAVIARESTYHCVWHHPKFSLFHLEHGKPLEQ